MAILLICSGVPEKSRKSSWIWRDEDEFGEGVEPDGLISGWVGLWVVEHVHGEGDREVEGVVCDSVDHDQRMSSYNGQNRHDVSRTKYALIQRRFAWDDSSRAIGACVAFVLVLSVMYWKGELTPRWMSMLLASSDVGGPISLLPSCSYLSVLLHPSQHVLL